MKSGYKQTEVGVIPEDWQIQPIEQISTVGRGRVISHREIARSLNPRYPVYSSQTSSNGVMGYLDTFEFEGDYITWTTDGANAGTVFARNGRFNCTNVCGTIKLKSDNHLFVAKVLGKIAPRHVSRHLGNPKLMNDVMKRVKIPLPPSKGEQAAIAEALSDADALIESLEQLLAKKRQLKQGAMQELLTGKKRLPGFESKPGYKQTEMGVIPQDWECVAIGPAIDLLTGFPFPSSGYTKAGVRLLRGSNIKRGATDWSDDGTQYWPAITFNIREYVLRAGDVVVAMDGSLVGRSFAMLSDNDLPALLLQRVARIRSEAIAQKFLKAWICSQRFTEHCDAVKTVTAIPHISPADIRSFKVALPPTKAEQEAIAAILSDMDAEIAALEAKLAKARQLKQGMMQELLTGRIRLV